MPIEITDGVRAVGDAHPDADAARIDLSDDSFRISVSRCNRTDLCTRRFVTVHAGQGDEAHLHIRIGSFHFRNKVHPKLRPSQFGFLLSCEGGAIFLPAGHHAGLARRALVEIDHHSPTVCVFRVRVRPPCLCIEFMLKTLPISLASDSHARNPI